MKNLIIIFGIIAAAAGISACEKAPEEKTIDKIGSSYDRDKDIQRSNEMGRQTDEALAKALGKPTKKE